MVQLTPLVIKLILSYKLIFSSCGDISTWREYGIYIHQNRTYSPYPSQTQLPTQKRPDKTLVQMSHLVPPPSLILPVGPLPLPLHPIVPRLGSRFGCLLAMLGSLQVTQGCDLMLQQRIRFAEEKIGNETESV